MPPGRGARPGRLLEEAGVNAQQRHVPPQRPVIASPRKQLPRKRLGGAGDKPLFIYWPGVDVEGSQHRRDPVPAARSRARGGVGGWMWRVAKCPRGCAAFLLLHPQLFVGCGPSGTWVGSQHPPVAVGGWQQGWPGP